MSTQSEHAGTSPRAQPALLQERFARVRGFSQRLAFPLSPEDCCIQSMPDVSPTRWHLAHTTWFFETFVLNQHSDYRCFDERFQYLFNSYYNSVGQQFPRERRGQISRPTLDETLDYRFYVDARVEALLSAGDFSEEQLSIIELGLNHEQQHQELMLTDIKHVLFGNPLFPAYDEQSAFDDSELAAVELQWDGFPERIVEIGWPESQGFCFDNETPRHKALILPHALANRCVTNGEYLQFVEAGGYQRPEYWLSLGWSHVQQAGWQSPLYWLERDGNWQHFTLAGIRPLRLHEPVCHVSYFEAEAFARWAGKRLPTEFEWEAHAAANADFVKTGQQIAATAEHLLASGMTVHPQVEIAPPCQTEGGQTTSPSTMLGNVWEWTSSQYMPYPGYRAAAGALGEYNGKFMCNQFVLRGGSCATSADHIRATYRNFFPPEARWQFSGFRLAEDTQR